MNTAGSPGDSAAAAAADAPAAAVEADAKPGGPTTAGGTTGTVSAAREPADAVGAAAEPARPGIAPAADADVVGSGAEAVGRGVAPAPDADAVGSVAGAVRRAPGLASDTDAVGTAAEAARSVPGPAPVVDAVSRDRLVYAFGETNAVDGLDLGVREGKVFGLLGPNGAGKTTAIRCITTLLPVPAGMVGVFGHDAANERMAVRRLLGYVPQQLSADSGLTGRENVALFARVFDMPRRERAERVSQALAAVGLADAADRLAGTYSGGMVRRLELAQVYVSAPRLLTLDEPTTGLDPIARTGVWEHINAVRAATGTTALVTTH